MLPFAPSTFLLAKVCVAPVTVSPPTSPVKVTTPAEVVKPSYTLVSVTALMPSGLAVMVPIAALAVGVGSV